MVGDTPENGRIETTTDHGTIRRWIEERGSTAARMTEPTGDDPGSLAVVPEGTDDDSVEVIPWEEFFRIFEEENLAFVHQTDRDDPDERWFCRFVDREREVGEDAFETERSETAWSADGRSEDGDTGGAIEHVDAVDDVEDVRGESAVEEGEVAETEVTRTEVIEKEVVVTDRVRSRVVGSEVVERNTLDGSVVDREIDRCEIVDENTIETEVVETRRVTEEVFEVHTVESEVVDSETVERERTGGQPDAIDEPTTGEPVVELTDSGLDHGTIVESEIVRRDLEAGALAEGEVVETEVVERRVLETEVVERIRIRSEIESVECIDSRLVEGEILESEIIEREPSERGSAAPAADEGPEPRIEDVASASELTEPEPTETTAFESEEPERRSAEPPVEVTEAETGKTVVNTYGEEIGVVSAVREGTLYVTPDPGLAERVTSSFGWGGGDDEAYPVEDDQIERIAADEIEIARL